MEARANGKLELFVTASVADLMAALEKEPDNPIGFLDGMTNTVTTVPPDGGLTLHQGSTVDLAAVFDEDSELVRQLFDTLLHMLEIKVERFYSYAKPGHSVDADSPEAANELLRIQIGAKPHKNIVTLHADGSPVFAGDAL